MNREILFRGKRMDNGEWVEGNLFIPDKVTRTVVPTEILMGTNLVRISYEVDPSTVGQYTGLTDKHGIKIFDGDIMIFDAYGQHYTGVVTIYKGNTCVLCGEKASPFLDDAIEKRGAVFIGNIHDNPELLRGGVENA